MKYFQLLGLLLVLMAQARAATIAATTPSRADVNTAISRSNPGDTVTVPAGSASWSGGVTISGITLQGAGTSITGGTVTITKHQSQPTKLIGFRFTSANSQHYAIGGDPGNAPFVVGDCHFNVGGATWGTLTTNGGLFYNCEFEAANPTSADLFAINLGGSTGSSAEASWTGAPTMGMDDTTGKVNTYFEDCTWTNLLEVSMDVDNGGRVAVRHCTFKDSSLTQHGGGSGTSGNDTSRFGGKQLEIYDCTFDRVSNSVGLNKWLWMRGGTGVFANNNVERADSPDGNSYPNKTEIRLTVGCPGPWPRAFQVGQAVSKAGNADSTPDFPFLIFGNTGAGASDSNFISTGENPNNACSNPGNFIKEGRDYMKSNTWGWTPYTYPHPLRDGSDPKPSPTPTPAPTPPDPNPGPGPVAPHTHSISEIEGLSEAIDGKADKGHVHPIPAGQTAE